MFGLGVLTMYKCALCKFGHSVEDIMYLSEYYTRNQKLACFVLYLKIINTFLKMIYIL